MIPLPPQEVISKLKVCSWKYNSTKQTLNDDRVHYGVIAQDVLTDFGSEYSFVNTDGQFLTVNYIEFIGPLVKCVQEQSKQIAQLQQQVDSLTQQVTHFTKYIDINKENTK